MTLDQKVSLLYLLTLGGLLHAFADWFLQNDWQAKNKAKRRERRGEIVGYTKEGGEVSIVPPTHWWDRHPAAYAHAGIHTVIQLVIFPWWACLLIGFLHLVIDTRSPLEWWGKFTRQTRPREWMSIHPYLAAPLPASVMDIGMEVAFWRDQVAHLVVLAGVALLCAF